MKILGWSIINHEFIYYIWDLKWTPQKLFKQFGCEARYLINTILKTFCIHNQAFCPKALIMNTKGFQNSLVLKKHLELKVSESFDCEYEMLLCITIFCLSDPKMKRKTFPLFSQLKQSITFGIQRKNVIQTIWMQRKVFVQLLLHKPLSTFVPNV